MNHPTVNVDTGLEREKEKLGLRWDEYLLYILEVDRGDVNEDALNQLADHLESGDTELLSVSEAIEMIEDGETEVDGVYGRD